LLAAWFFARSSEQWHQRLLASELFGPMIRNWEERRCVSLRTKCVGIVSMLVAGSASIVFALENPWARLASALLMLTGALTLASIKTCPAEGRPAEGCPAEGCPAEGRTDEAFPVKPTNEEDASPR
jgi:hypothetical protein